MFVWVFPLGLTFSSSLSLEFCVSQSLFDSNKLPQNEIRLSSQLCREKLLRPVLGACRKNDFVVKAGCECRRRLIHYLKVTLDPGWPTTTLVIRLLGEVKNVTAYSFYSPAAWLPWRPQEPSWGGTWWLVWTTTFVDILKLGISHKPSEPAEMPSLCQLLYNKLQVLSFLLYWVESPELCPKTISSEPRPRGGKSWDQAPERGSTAHVFRLSTHSMDAP